MLNILQRYTFFMYATKEKGKSILVRDNFTQKQPIILPHCMCVSQKYDWKMIALFSSNIFICFVNKGRCFGLKTFNYS